MANFEELWDWTEGVLTSGIFDSDIDEQGNIMMYNRLIGGLRFRQLRVRNNMVPSAPLLSKQQTPSAQIGRRAAVLVSYCILGDAGCRAERTVLVRNCPEQGGNRAALGLGAPPDT